jgi:hypothetical protein
VEYLHSHCKVPGSKMDANVLIIEKRRGRYGNYTQGKV